MTEVDRHTVNTAWKRYRRHAPQSLYLKQLAFKKDEFHQFIGLPKDTFIVWAMGRSTTGLLSVTELGAAKINILANTPPENWYVLIKAAIAKYSE